MSEPVWQPTRSGRPNHSEVTNFVLNDSGSPYTCFGSVIIYTKMPKSNRNELSFEPDLLLISNALVIVSGKWRLYIILVLGEQTLRYSQLSDRLPGVSEKVLAGELKALVTLGVMKREAFAEVPLRVEYTLTERGRLILPILQQVQQIGKIFN